MEKLNKTYYKFLNSIPRDKYLDYEDIPISKIKLTQKEKRREINKGRSKEYHEKNREKRLVYFKKRYKKTKEKRNK